MNEQRASRGRTMGQVRGRRQWAGLLMVMLAVALVLPILPATPVRAATITVDTYVDGPVIATNCTDTIGGNCKVRDAIAAAQAGDTIIIAPPAEPRTTTLTGGQLLLERNVTITGPGAMLLTISGNNASRVFAITGGRTATISGLTIANGRAGGGSDINGGGIRNNGTLTVTNGTLTGNTASVGGGLSSMGTLTVANSTISNNTASASDGGLNNFGIATITGSTISDNTAVVNGGGLGHFGASDLTLANSTISTNTAGGFGGGIDNFGTSGTFTMRNVTITGNTATGSNGGGIHHRGGTLDIGNTLLTGNTAMTGPDYFYATGIVTSRGHNFIGRYIVGTFSTVMTDIIGNTDAVLGSLANNGGPTRTHALLTSGTAANRSPVNNGDNALCAQALVSNRDQRGVTRPQGSACDIGAFEVGQTAPTPTMTPMTPMVPITPTTPTTAACLPLAPGSAFAFTAFQSQWQAGEALAPNFWGPTATGNLQEQYADSPGGMRLVQYFDKGRMELTDPMNGTVTNGLLANELIGGQMQVGDSAFQARTGANIPIAGDPDNAGPTYAQLGSTAKSLFDPTPERLGFTVTTTLDATGATIPGFNLVNTETIIASYDGMTQHNVPGAFARYRDQVGVLTVGYAKSEPFLAMVKVGGVQKRVMVQVFERRVLTYTPENPDPYKVEMGNIGQHYYRWRYCAS